MSNGINLDRNCSHRITFVMHHDPSGPGFALEKSTTPLKSGSSGSWMGEKGTSGSGPAAGMGLGLGLARLTRDNIPN